MQKIEEHSFFTCQVFTLMVHICGIRDPGSKDGYYFSLQRLFARDWRSGKFTLFLGILQNWYPAQCNRKAFPVLSSILPHPTEHEWNGREIFSKAGELPLLCRPHPYSTDQLFQNQILTDTVAKPMSLATCLFKANKNTRQNWVRQIGGGEGHPILCCYIFFSDGWITFYFSVMHKIL